MKRKRPVSYGAAVVYCVAVGGTTEGSPLHTSLLYLNRSSLLSELIAVKRPNRLTFYKNC
jgi:hypothetical protein